MWFSLCSSCTTSFKIKSCTDLTSSPQNVTWCRAEDDSIIVCWMMYAIIVCWIREFHGKKYSVCIRYGRNEQSQLTTVPSSVRNRRYGSIRTAGVDYAGPLQMRGSICSWTINQKMWTVAFLCMCMSALHLDLAADLTTVAFFERFKRFVSKRGNCGHMYSEIGSSLVGVQQSNKTAFRIWTAPDSIEYLNREGMLRHFMNPASPHQVGIYSAAVNSTKCHLIRVFANSLYGQDQHLTLIGQLDAFLNFRPSCSNTDVPTVSPVNTPAHFLNGKPLVVPPPIGSPAKADSSLPRAQ